jgi:hypothetical protein
MSAVFDGHDIWQDWTAKPTTLTKEQQEKWDKIQANCKEVAAFSVQFAKEEEIRWAETHNRRIDMDFAKEETSGC